MDAEIDEEERGCDSRRSTCCAMAAGAAVVVRWPPEQQVCRAVIPFIEAAEQVMSPDKLSAGSGSGWMGGAEEPPETKPKRAVSQHLSFKGSVFGKMLADETAPLWAPYLSTIKYQVQNVSVCCSRNSGGIP